MNEPGEDGRMRKAVGVYDRPANANGHRKIAVMVVIAVLAIAMLALFFFPRTARSAEMAAGVESVDNSGTATTAPAQSTAPGPSSGIFIQWSRDAVPPETGFASVYAADLERRPTASGSPYDSSLLTAAHRSLPFGTRLRVTDEASGRSVIVTVNDRWAPPSGWAINLSRGAALTLGVNTTTRRSVRLEVESLGDGTRVAPERADVAPPVLPARIDEDTEVGAASGVMTIAAPVEPDVDRVARRCGNEADILGLRGPWRENHLRNCARRAGRTQIGTSMTR